MGENELIGEARNEMNKTISNNTNILSAARKAEVRKSELKLIEEGLKNLENSEDSVKIVKSVLDQRHRQEIADLEEKYSVEREQLLVQSTPENRINVLSDWEYRFNQERLQLKNEHYNELVLYLGKISPKTSEMLLKQNAEKDKKREQLNIEKEELEKQFELEATKFEAQHQEKINKKLAEEEKRLEYELEAERTKMEKAFAENTAQVELESQKQAEIKAAKEKGATAEEMEKIIEKWAHAQDMSKTNTEIEKMKSKKQLEERKKLEGEKKKKKKKKKK